MRASRIVPKLARALRDTCRIFLWQQASYAPDDQGAAAEVYIYKCSGEKLCGCSRRICASEDFGVAIRDLVGTGETHTDSPARRSSLRTRKRDRQSLGELAVNTRSPAGLRQRR
jgi:hypothetical protein